MKTKTKYPSWFYPNYPPSDVPEYLNPRETITEHKKIEDLYYCDEYQTSEEFEGQPVFIKWELNYDSCYYESDNPSISVIKFVKVNKPNPLYKREAKRFEEQKKLLESQREEWKKWKAIWDEEQSEKNKLDQLKAEKREKLLYNKLKKKYEQNNRDGKA